MRRLLEEGLHFAERKVWIILLQVMAVISLLGDGGYRGVVFHICHTMNDVAYEEKGTELLVEAGAGAMLSSLARQVSSKGYTGFEYATGIPGTLGGGVTMNAGAYGGEISDNLLWAELMDETGQFCV